MVRRLLSAAAVALAVVTMSGCTQSGSGPESRLDSSPAPPAATPARAEAEPFRLYTHCGIDELTLHGKWYQRVGGRLGDQARNPPPDWGNPYQRGTVTVVGDRVTFRDAQGHRETFALRPGATDPLFRCD